MKQYEEVQKHIFEKFYQRDTSLMSDGNGLELVLVKRIIDLCKVQFQCKVNKTKMLLSPYHFHY